MLKKGLILLLFSLVIGTLVELAFPWRTQATLRPGDSRTFKEEGEFIVPVPGKDRTTFDLAKDADPMMKTSKFGTEGGLVTDQAKATVQPKQVQWTEGSKNNKKTITAYGAALTIEGAVKAPATVGQTAVVPLTWHSEYFRAVKEFSGGMTFKHGDLRWQGDRVLVNEWILAGDGYWTLCLRKAFYMGVPWAVAIFTILATFLFGKTAKFEPPSGFPVYFPPNYTNARTYFCIFGLVVGLPGLIFAIINSTSNTGDHLDDHWLTALLTAGGLVTVLSLAALIRWKGPAAVELHEEELVVSKGDGWGPREVVPWRDIRSLEPEVKMKGKQVLVKQVNVKYDSARGPRKLRVTSNSTKEYDTFLTMAQTLWARHQPAAQTTTPPPVG